MKVIKRQSDSKNNGLRQETSLRSDSGTNSAKKMNELLNN